jgi:hypothetical protein
MIQVQLFFSLFLSTCGLTAFAQESMIEIDLERNGASVPAYPQRSSYLSKAVRIPKVMCVRQGIGMASLISKKRLFKRLRLG